MAGEIPEDLTATERATFSKMVRDVPLLFELLDEGALDGFLGEDLRGIGHRDDHLDGDDHRDEDEDGDAFGELAWSP